jgi:glycosyltransferase involved in cell wall biosynthesis
MLEAMSCNVPVINQYFINARSFWSSTYYKLLIRRNYPRLIEILNDDAYRKLCDKGLERSKQFSWKNMARDLKHELLI